MSQEEESPIQVTLGGVIDSLEHALELSQEQTPPAEPAPEGEGEQTPPEGVDAGGATHHTTSAESWASIAAANSTTAHALYLLNHTMHPNQNFGEVGMPVNKDIALS